MAYRILVPLDGTPEGERALSHVVNLALPDDEVLLLNVMPDFSTPVGMPPTRRLDLGMDAAAYLQSARRKLPGTHGPLLLLSGDARDCIARVVIDRRVDLVVMPDSPLATSVLRGNAGPVLVVPEVARPSRGPRRILVALHAWAWTRDIVDDAERLARHSDAELVLLHVEEEAADPLPETATTTRLGHDRTRRLLQEIADRLELEGVIAWPVVTAGRPARRIVEEAERLGADIIAMATHARGWLERVLLPSVSSQVLHRARRPVLLQQAAVREPALEGSKP